MTLLAGAAAVDISPTGPVALFGYPHVERTATGVHDPLLASALYLNDGPQAAVLIALDLLMLDVPVTRSMRRAVSERLGLAEQQVFINCTHTHSGPVTSRLLAWADDPTIPGPDADYLQWITEQVVLSATRAAAEAQAAEMAWTSADARGVGGNRHASDGPTDPEAGILFVRRAGGGPAVAVTVIYGMHPTVLHEDSRLVSADFPNYLRQELRERFGPSLVVLYQMGPSGNQSPRFFVTGQTFSEAERLGRMLGKAVAGGLEKLTPRDFHGDCRLQGTLQTLELPRRKMPPVAEAKQILDAYRTEYERLKSQHAEKAQVRTAECAVFGAEGTLTLAGLQASGELDKALNASRPIEMQLLQLGDVALLGLPGEWFAEYALELKRRWPGKVFVTSMVNGHLYGYITTAEAAARGGYEALTTVFDAATAGPRLFETAAQLLAPAKLLPSANEAAL
jgi:hypothetical protein